MVCREKWVASSGVLTHDIFNYQCSYHWQLPWLQTAIHHTCLGVTSESHPMHVCVMYLSNNCSNTYVQTNTDTTPQSLQLRHHEVRRVWQGSFFLSTIPYLLILAQLILVIWLKTVNLCAWVANSLLHASRYALSCHTTYVHDVLLYAHAHVMSTLMHVLSSRSPQPRSTLECYSIDKYSNFRNR